MKLTEKEKQQILTKIEDVKNVIKETDWEGYGQKFALENLNAAALFVKTELTGGDDDA